MQAVSFEKKEFQRLSQLLGKVAAAQAVMLMLAHRKQQDSSFQLQDIAHLPGHQKFSGLKKLEQEYNGSFPMPPILENVPRLAPGTFDDSDSVIGDTVSVLGGQASSPAQQWLQKRSPMVSSSRPCSSVFQPSGGLGGGDLAPANVKAGRHHPSMSAAAVSGSAGPALDLNSHTLWPTAGTVDSHFMRANHIQIKDHALTRKFSGHPKLWVELQRPNALNLQWVYSVPCGDCPKRWPTARSYSWIFLTNLKQGEGESQRAAEILSTHGWSTVNNGTNKRFICSKCRSPGIEI